MNDSKRNVLRMVVGGSDFSIADFVNCIQGFSLGLRLTHWETSSFALHKAAEQIQDSIDGSLDAFVEAYVGSCGGKRPSFTGKVEKEIDTDKVISCLKSINVSDTSLLNIRDEMLQAVYKFKYLKTLS